ncbi:2-keto-4-pentenoate hydratase [Streptomyces rugosispiralis]|uniref:4-oxalocrotonate decarboxylase n=1 Tax=Streptomyces rugosispiralis TaxID=2967341 RepID=A0ABT1URY1_9ACTN|nr:4-oxalocrotonate decarboxylase [Streptomyces rugosispiralis]MCQ8187878.1 4-oxalocrotonate decarboxylase [Streptomyces rugosispiralis]
MTGDEDIHSLARRLDDAQRRREETSSLADTAAVDVNTAYAVQEALLARRTGRGERVVGVKLGFTSKAKMAQMGVSEVIVGRLTDAMRVADRGEADLRRFIHPKAEPEVAYRLGRDIGPDEPAPDMESLVDAVAPAIEIIDSRYRDFRFTYTDVIADNASAAGFVLGAWQSVQDVSDRAVRLRVGDREVAGSTTAILGDPARAVHALLTLAGRRRIPLRAGQIVLAGAATEAVPLGPGHVEAEVAGLGTVSWKGV